MDGTARRGGQWLCCTHALCALVGDVLIRHTIRCATIFGQQSPCLANGRQIGYGRDVEQPDRFGNWHGTSIGYGLYQRLSQLDLSGLGDPSATLTQLRPSLLSAHAAPL